MGVGIAGNSLYNNGTTYPSPKSSPRLVRGLLGPAGPPGESECAHGLGCHSKMSTTSIQFYPRKTIPSFFLFNSPTTYCNCIYWMYVIFRFAWCLLSSAVRGTNKGCSSEMWQTSNPYPVSAWSGCLGATQSILSNSSLEAAILIPNIETLDLQLYKHDAAPLV